ncbi:hypothetical protein J2Y69_003362 [Microbacterium resistens]|uniref:Uncharacterized protein n=1 Tax=Microbacterium resistens TaxID=156977 RepID=A0ABU1SGK7_9MICO|nr:hypothetical protein [Microbacterium resistens]MDR6868738.1 hypothetical protein [Microbacterium resistens]
MTVDLSPGRLGNAQPPYLTVIPGRSSVRDKLHATRGQATAALAYQMEGYYPSDKAPRAGALYGWDGTTWALIWSCQRGDDVTGRPWKAAVLEWEATR